MRAGFDFGEIVQLVNYDSKLAECNLIRGMETQEHRSSNIYTLHCGETIIDGGNRDPNGEHWLVGQFAEFYGIRTIIDRYSLKTPDEFEKLHEGLSEIEIKEIGTITLRNLKRIIITHAHDDHTHELGNLLGISKSLQEEFGEQLGFNDILLPKIYVHEKGYERAEISAPDPKNIGAIGSIRLAETPLEVELVKDGDFIEDTGLKVIYTPGHTVDSICLYDDKSKTLYAGDAVFPLRGPSQEDSFLTVPYYCEKDEKITEEEEAKQRLRRSIPMRQESLRRLAELDVKNIMPGHFYPSFRDGSKQIEKSYIDAKSRTVEQEVQMVLEMIFQNKQA